MAGTADCLVILENLNFFGLFPLLPIRADRKKILILEDPKGYISCLIINIPGLSN